MGTGGAFPRVNATEADTILFNELYVPSQVSRKTTNLPNRIPDMEAITCYVKRLCKIYKLKNIYLKDLEPWPSGHKIIHREVQEGRF
jgi:hypothetical protein